MSRLSRLYRYAKAGRSEALENFTTEALACAIEVDPAPFVDALRQRKIADGSTTNAVFGVEVKLSAGEHGDQLAVYEGIARSLGPTRPKVITLARFPKIKDGVDGITWRDLAESRRHHLTGATSCVSSRSTGWPSIRRTG